MSETSADHPQRFAWCTLKASPLLFVLGLAGGMTCWAFGQLAIARGYGLSSISFLVGIPWAILIITHWRYRLPALPCLAAAFPVVAFGLMLLIFKLPLESGADLWQLGLAHLLFALAGLGLHLLLSRARLTQEFQARGPACADPA